MPWLSSNREVIALTSRLVVIAGPSGVGKGSVVKEILKKHSDFVLSISNTTRSPRPGEVDGRDYFFVSESDFEAQKAAGGLLEHAVVHGNKQYGTPKTPVLDNLAEGKSVILEIDVQGAMQVKANFPSCVTVFISPPNMQELAARLAGRGTETPQEQAIRLETAEQEMSLSKEFDFVVVNRIVSECADEVVKLVHANPIE